ncbi:hypothetical protein LHYA1_G001181 [Lachnellula hyalina]|uniref:Uncharacterized protein n=1 Tax=Lachnellula hyalina TaxID=1316788 RepID=A0A8H8R8R5_9HELO|nr:uncharacterized protein LHYA1_G001181 [Lachnellula hyalina]TVY30694.1 hypothetical protein LHYA1_G001181 [Lachnellula hyalina]
MSSQQRDSFLPSGAIDPPRYPHQMTSPQNVPRSLPETTSFVPSLPGSDHNSPNTYNRSPSQHPNGHPISPPKTRSASADDNSAALIEDWRIYTQKLRMQSEGERAHMMADRARVEEVMAEERALWDREREILCARIAELERQLQSESRSSSDTVVSRPLYHKQSSLNMGAQQITSPGSHSSSSNDRNVPQESGRNADGSPFYAPAARNPSRTFDVSSNSDLRVDSISAPRESAIRVTSKELTSSDFVQSPPVLSTSHDLSPIVESIDIQKIQPELEGVPIKVTAVDPTFAFQVLSPNSSSPAKLSPNTKPPRQDKTLEVIHSPADRRLTLHAGHTPNHSISKFGDIIGDQTPTQDHHSEQLDTASDDGDKELTGTLGLTNDSINNDDFLITLHKKLIVEAKKSGTTSPEEDPSPVADSGPSSGVVEPLIEPSDKDDGPVLRVKASLNFGRPLGRM